MENKFTKRGFTLVELLIYIAVVAIIFLAMVSFILTMSESKAKRTVMSEVASSARIIQERLMDAGRHAQTINVGASTFDVDPGVLSLDMVNVFEDPMVFSLTGDNGQFQVSTAGGEAIPLTNTTVAITHLLFSNLTSAEDTGIIQVQFTVQAVNSSGSPLFDYEESFQTTLRIPLD